MSLLTGDLLGPPFAIAPCVSPCPVVCLCLFIVVILECKSDEASLECNLVFVCLFFYVFKGGVRFPGEVGVLVHPCLRCTVVV